MFEYILAEDCGAVKVLDCGAGGVFARDTGGAARFRNITLAFGANRLKRSLSVIGGNTFGSDILTDDIDIAFIRNVRGANLI